MCAQRVSAGWIENFTLLYRLWINYGWGNVVHFICAICMIYSVQFGNQRYKAVQSTGHGSCLPDGTDIVFTDSNLG